MHSLVNILQKNCGIAYWLSQQKNENKTFKIYDFHQQPYEQCNASKHQTAKIYEEGSELKKFEKSDIYKKMIHEVSYRLGYNRSLNHKAIMLMWNMCRYELAWHTDKLSAWCAVRFNYKNIYQFSFLIPIFYRHLHHQTSKF